MSLDAIKAELPALSAAQWAQLAQLEAAFADWNARVNLVSRKDFEHFTGRHLLHCLLLTRLEGGVLQPGWRVLDLGTGGGLPGLPLAVAYPEVHFTLLDARQKKIKAIEAMAAEVGLPNVSAVWARAEDWVQGQKGAFEVVTGRAVTRLPDFWGWAKPYLKRQLPALGGLWYWKGGALDEELAPLQAQGLACTEYPLAALTALAYYSTKKIVHVRP